MASPGQYRLDLIGAFGLFAPDGTRIEITSRKSIALIGLLAVAPGGRRSREYLRTILWCNADRQEAQASLRRELSNLRKTMKAQNCEHLITAEMQRISLNVEKVDVDIFMLGLASGERRWLAESEFLEGLDLPNEEAFEEWLRNERSRIAELIEDDLDNHSETPPTPEQIFGGALPTSSEILSGDPISLPPKPSLAIAPFDSLLGPEDDWIAAAISEDLAKRISQFPQLFVASSGSSRRMAERNLTASEICQELGVAYLLEGRLLRAFDRIRVMVALVDGKTGEQVWADSLDGRPDDLWDLHERLSKAIAPRIWTVVDLAERDRGLRNFGSPQGNYETYWRANALLRSWDAQSVNEASQLSEVLTRESPTCPWASSIAAYCNSIGYLMSFAPDREAARRRASLHSQTAMRYGSDNVEAIGYVAGTILNIGGDIERADRLISRALNIIPAFQPTLFWGGWVDFARGDIERAVQRFDLALRLNPASGARAQTLCGLGYCALMQSKLEDAHAHFKQADAEDPLFPLGKMGVVLVQMASGESTSPEAMAQASIAETGAAFFSILRREEDRRKLLSLLVPVASTEQL